MEISRLPNDKEIVQIAKAGFYGNAGMLSMVTDEDLMYEDKVDNESISFYRLSKKKGHGLRLGDTILAIAMGNDWLQFDAQGERFNQMSAIRKMIQLKILTITTDD